MEVRECARMQKGVGGAAANEKGEGAKGVPKTGDLRK